MDDFFPLASETHDSNANGILQTYFSNMFADGSALSSDMPELGDKIKTPLENLGVAKEYLETSQSDVRWRDRLWKVAEDTTTVN